MSQLLASIALCLIINCSLSIAGKSYFSVFLHRKFLVQPTHTMQILFCFQLARNCQFDVIDVFQGNITYPENQCNTRTKISWKHSPDVDAGMSLRQTDSCVHLYRLWNLGLGFVRKIIFEYCKFEIFEYSNTYVYYSTPCFKKQFSVSTGANVHWLPGKTRFQNDLVCVKWDVKSHTLTHSLIIHC